MAHRITLLTFDECFASNIVGSADLLNTANLVAARSDPGRTPAFEWQVLSPGGRAIRGSSGLELPVDGALERDPPGKLIIVPAYGSPDVESLFAALRSHRRQLLPWLRAQYQSGVTIAANCSGSFILAEAGLLDGMTATTAWWLVPTFEQRYPNARVDATALLTESGRIICSGAGMSHVDLVLHLIGRLVGRETAHACAKYVAIDDTRRSQAPYLVANHLCSDDPLVTRAERWIKANLHHPFTIDRLAGHVAVSPRTLSRHFKDRTGDSPLAFVQRVRVETSKALLENTRLRIGEIVDRAGYGDDSSFRRQFKRHTSLSPNEYRQRFRLRER